MTSDEDEGLDFFVGRWGSGSILFAGVEGVAALADGAQVVIDAGRLPLSGPRLPSSSLRWSCVRSDLRTSSLF